MFTKTILLSAVFALLSSTANGHAMVTPAMGVSGKASRSNVQRPSTAKPCGNANIAIDSAQTVAANAQGVFTVTAQNFNGGKDGSRQFTMQVDAAGTGKNFVAGQVTKNGDLAPKDVGTQQLTASLPAGTKCTGGQSKNRCLVSFKNASGFGNCVVVSQGTQKRGEVADTAATDASATPAATSATATDASAQKVDDAAAASAADAQKAANNAAAAKGKAAKVAKDKKAGKKGGKKGKKAANKNQNKNKNADTNANNGSAAASTQIVPPAAAAANVAAPAAAGASMANTAPASGAVKVRSVVGTRAARAARAEPCEEKGRVKRSVFEWIWV
jgi:hypothetical protein